MYPHMCIRAGGIETFSENSTLAGLKGKRYIVIVCKIWVDSDQNEEEKLHKML